MSVQCQTRNYINNRDENGAMYNGHEPTGTSDTRGDLTGSRGVTNRDGHGKEKVVKYREDMKQKTPEQLPICRWKCLGGRFSLRLRRGNLEDQGGPVRY